MSLEDGARSGVPVDVTDKEMCHKVRDLVYSDRRIQVEEIAQALGISHGSISTILLDH
jgi:DNA-binding transcriptional regulator LsrR (DeoR family)